MGYRMLSPEPGHMDRPTTRARRGPHRTRPPFLPVWVAVVDLALVHIGFVTAFAVRFGGSFPRENFEAYISSIPGISLLAGVLLLTYGLYDLRAQSRRTTASGILAAMTLFPAFSMALSFIVRAFAFPRTVILIAWVLHIILLIAWRGLVRDYVETTWGRPRALVVGPVAEALKLAEKIGAGDRAGYEIVGVLIAGEKPAAEPSGLGPFPLYPLDALEDVQSHAGDPADEIIITPSTGREDKAWVADLAARTSTRVLIVPGYRDLLVFDSRMAQLDGTLAFEVGSLGVPGHVAWAKRSIDVALAVVGLAITAPFFPFIAAAVRLSSAGPVFYSQTRVGQGGRHYSLLKFRTMVAGAEEQTGPVLATRTDPRVTRVGRVLRRYRLDELPQLVNVLAGSMSLVGPRPERPEFVAEHARALPYYGHRHLLKPGLTGLAQLYAGYDAPVEEKLRYDLLYAKRYSLLLDARIILLTGALLLAGDEAHWRGNDSGEGG